ncbi:MAG: hypothetical protein K0S93_2347, partial [Nitrososphaeraceae archaeon]|nr:hypothetical protein [Nitrososphaeraceae archaeon]
MHLVIIIASILFAFSLIQWQFYFVDGLIPLVKNNPYPSVLDFEIPYDIQISNNNSENISISQTEEDDFNFYPNAVVKISPNLVRPFNPVILDASSSYDNDPGDIITSYLWQSRNPSIQLNSTTSPIVQFIAPEVQQPTFFPFTLTVTDSSFAEGTISFGVTVNPCDDDGGPVEPASIERLSTAQLGCVVEPEVKVKGKIFLETPKADRGDILIRNLKVELCSSNNNCPETTYTDKQGNFDLSSNKISKAQAKLKITFINKEKDLLAAQYPKTQPATILFSNLPFILDANGNYIANTNIKIFPLFPHLTINNIQGSRSLSNIDALHLANLAAFYYYGEKALEYSKPNIPIPIDYKLPLKIFINSP